MSGEDDDGKEIFCLNQNGIAHLRLFTRFSVCPPVSPIKAIRPLSFGIPEQE
jgi:hypothetical protein